MSKFTTYEEVKNQSTEDYFNNNQFSIDAFNKKYRIDDKETYVKSLKRVCDFIASVEETEEKRQYWSARWFHEIYNDWWHPAGSIMQGAGSNRNISASNCTTISLGVNDTNRNWDNLESIFKNTAYTVAKCAAFRQGLGVDFSRLRPKNTKVYNSANESTGAIHWMKFIDSIGYYVGQKGRIPAMLFSLNCSHPDVEEFITCKADYTKIQNANISVQCTDAFYEAVEKDKEWELSFEIPEVKKGQKVYVDVHSIDRDILKDNKGFYYIARQNRPYEKFTEKVSARKLLELIAKHMTLNAEPGIQNIDIARRYSNSDYLYDPNEEYDTRIISSNAPVVGDTLIPTVFGIKPIKELFEKETVEVISDTITTLPANLIDHNNLKTTYGKYNFPTKTIPVTATFKKYEKQQVYEIHLNNGCVLKCNSEHKWLINGEMTKTVDIKIGDKLFKPNGGIYQSYDLKTDFNAPNFQLGDLVGYIVGDGWIGKASNLHNKMIGIVYDSDCTHYSESFRKLYNKITGKNLSGERDRGKIHEIRTEQVDFVKFFEQFGLINNKYIVPIQCYTDKEFCAGFLRGLFQADSHVRWNGKQGYINLTTVSPEIANGVRDLLSNWFGIHVTITKTKGVGVKYGNNKISNAKDKYDVRIAIRNHMIRFRDLIGLIGNKGEKLKLIHNNCQQYNNRISSIVQNVIKTDKYEDMYCAVVPGLQSFVVNGYISSNCSEQYLSRESLCVLASINAGKFSIVEEEYKKELETIGESINRFLDNVNECELRYGTYATPHQKLAIQQLRRTGAGYTNLVEWLFNQNEAYGSKEGNDKVENFTKWYNYYLYKSSIALGKEKGNFGAFNREKLEKSPFIQRMIGMGLKFTHLRNVTCSSIAPTGSLTLMFRYLLMSYGIEPAFDLYFWKRTRISGRYEYYFCVPNAVRRVFAKHGINLPISSDTVKDTWDGKIGRAVAKIIDENKVKLNLNFQKSTEVTCMDKLDLMAKAMKWIDSSISVTYLLPENANWKDVYDFILEANKREVKSIAAFPDKKMYGIVSFVPFKDLAFKLTAEGVDIHAQNFTDEELKELNISRENINVQNNAPKRLKSLNCDLHYITHNNENYLVVIGIQNGVPYEVFGGHIRSNSKLLQDKPKQGTIIRNGQANYSLELPNQRIDHFGSTFTPFEQTIFRLASTMMRHGVPIQYIVEQLSKAAQDIHSIENIIARVLKKYIKDGQKISGKECPSCKSTDLVYQEGCVTCSKCNWSKCS